jgi:hypothetical protein
MFIIFMLFQSFLLIFWQQCRLWLSALSFRSPLFNQSTIRWEHRKSQTEQNRTQTRYQHIRMQSIFQTPNSKWYNILGCSPNSPVQQLQWLHNNQCNDCKN